MFDDEFIGALTEPVAFPCTLQAEAVSLCGLINSATWVTLGAGFTVRAMGSLSTRCRVLHAVGILQLLCKSLTSSYVTMRGPCSVGLRRGHTRNEIPPHTLRSGANCIVCVSSRFRFWFSCSSAHTTVSPVVCVRDIWLLSSRIKRLSTAL